MSVQRALEFIEHVRQDDELKALVATISGQDSIDQLCQLALENGFIISSDDLESAFKKDWAMRWFLYSSKPTL